MKNEKILEMLNNGEIEELKKVISEEIYNNSLDKNGNAKSRYKAMKDFYKFPSDKTDTRFLKPFRDAYYKIGLLNKGYSIIEGGKYQKAFYGGSKKPLYIYNSLGIVMLLPVRIDVALRDSKDKDFVYIER